MEKIMSTHISVIVTVLNEERSIVQLLQSLTAQTLKPKEIILADGGSHDQTCALIQTFADEHVDEHIKLLHKIGNRSIGRNTALENASNELLAITNAGCIPHKNWLEE